MKKSFRFSLALLASLCLTLFVTQEAAARKIYVIKGGPGDGGKYYNGSTTQFFPGDTLVLTASQSPYAYFTLENVHGNASQPIVVINEGGQVDVTNGIALTSCTYIKFTGSGTSDAYGFTSQSGSGVGMTVSKRSAHIEIERLYFNNKTYGFWIKQEADCDPALQFPNWVLDDFKVHDNKMTNMGQSGLYLGSTAPNGERSIVCNGATVYPKPLRLGNFKVYNNIIDRTHRAAIQLSGAQYGTNEIYNNTITNVGLEYNTAQGNGIVLGGYTSAYVHHNTINYTYSSGIFSLGAGLIRIENNTINNSGVLYGNSTNGMSNIMIDTRETSPVINTTFHIKNNTVGSNTDYHVRIYKSFSTFNSDNVICANMPPSGNYTAAIAQGINYTGCNGAVNLPPTANAGPDQTITLPVSSLQLTGSGLDPDGNNMSYTWTKIAGPAQFSITNPSASQTTFTNLAAGIYTFRLTVTDNGGASATDDVNVTVIGTGGSTGTGPAPLPTTNYVSIPGKVEAEAHAAQSGTQLEGTSDAGGGQNVGYIDPSDWMDYNISVATAGTYTLSLRVASGAAGGTLQVRKPDGTVLSTVSIPSTGGWQAWQSVSTSITLAAGQQSLRLISTGGGWNINYLEFAAGATTAPAPTPSTAIALPGKVEAEAFSSQSGTQNEGTSDAGGGQNVGYIDNGDWMDYSVNPTQAGTYTVSLRVASPSSGGSLQLRKSDGSVLTTVSIPNTGGYQSWQSVTATLYLNQGTQTIRLHSSSSNWNINYLNFTLGGTTTTPTPTPTPPSGTQRIEAEAYTAQSGTQKEGTQDSGGGENLGYIDNGDWMEYSVNVAQSATYTVSFRVASQQWGGQLQLRKADGSVLATVAVPYTSGWQTWQSVTASIYLNQGVQTLRIQSTQPANWNINYFELTQGSGGTTTTPAPTPSAGYTALPGKVEAESFSAQSGIQTEGTQDNGGGQNVGYIDYLDWMEYKVSPASAATYTLSLRIATPNNNAQLQLRKADGTVLTTVSLPNTGGYQTWQSVNVSVSLAGGDQTVRVVSTGGGSFNINYLEFAAPSASLTQSTPGVETLSDAISVSQPLEVFPNPIETNFQLKINNTLTGALKVEMINMQGVSIKTFNLQKSSAATSQFYLSASELPQGQYILKATMQNWEKTVNVMKN